MALELEAFVEKILKEDKELHPSESSLRWSMYFADSGRTHSSLRCFPACFAAPSLSAHYSRRILPGVSAFQLFLSNDSRTKAVGHHKLSRVCSCEPVLMSGRELTPRLISVSSLRCVPHLGCHKKTQCQSCTHDSRPTVTAGPMKYRGAFQASQYVRKCRFPTMALCINCDMSRFSNPPHPHP